MNFSCPDLGSDFHFGFCKEENWVPQWKTLAQLNQKLRRTILKTVNTEWHKKKIQIFLYTYVLHKRFFHRVTFKKIFQIIKLKLQGFGQPKSRLLQQWIEKWNQTHWEQTWNWNNLGATYLSGMHWARIFNAEINFYVLFVEEKNKNNHKSYVSFKRVEKYRKNYSYILLVFQYHWMLRKQGRDK